MANSKYAKYVKRLSFSDEGPGSYRQGTRMSGEFLGLDVNIEYGTYWTAGRIGKEPSGSHVHDFDQVMLWLGADTSDVGELGAEVELQLGEERERHMITTSTAVAVPKGFPHFPATIARMSKRFLFMEVSFAREWSATQLPPDEGAAANAPVAGFGARHRDRILNLPFVRKGAWHYGPKNPDDSGGTLSFIRGKELGLDFLIMCESIRKAPYRFGPDPERPHSHSKPEVLVFMGVDMNDLTELGGEVEISLGDEEERHVITTPTAVVVPGGLPHLPLTITRLEKPFIMIDIRPFGTEAPSGPR